METARFETPMILRSLNVGIVSGTGLDPWWTWKLVRV